MARNRHLASRGGPDLPGKGIRRIWVFHEIEARRVGVGGRAASDGLVAASPGSRFSAF